MSDTRKVTPLRMVLAGALMIALAACDNTEQRVKKAQDLGGAVLDQLSGKDVNRPPERNLEEYSVEARALYGSIQPLSQPSPTNEISRRYVIGSIVAKPRNIPEPIEIASVKNNPSLIEYAAHDATEAEGKIIIPTEELVEEAQEKPELLDEIERPAMMKSRSITVVDPRIQARPRSFGARIEPTQRPALRDRVEAQRPVLAQRPAPVIARPVLSAEQRVEALPDLQPKLASRAIMMQQETLVRQMSAEDRMIETATKYGLAASVQRSRTGQMVIEIGADALRPTQFMAQSAPRQVFGVDRGVGCQGEEASQTDTEVAMECVIEELSATGEFEYVEKDYLFDHQLIRTPTGEQMAPVAIAPNDPLFDLQWHYAGQDVSEGGAGFTDFWTREGTQGSSDVVVAVIDTGLEMAHPDIAGSANIGSGWDMVSDPLMGNDGNGRDNDPNDAGDACPEKGVFKNSFHGTHVAGTVGAGLTNNSAGVAGGAWNVTIVPVRALGKCGGRLSDINDAIRWAAGTIPEFDELGNEVWNDNPADIINLSIGLFKRCPASMQDAIDAVTAEGVVVVAAAGNARVSTDLYAPGGCRNVVTVAGGDARGHIAPYSNFGPAVDLLAPGGDLSRDDNGDNNPDGVLSTKTAENCFDPVSGSAIAKCFYAYEQGTSMAAPHVSAALALLQSKRPDLSGQDLVTRLLDGATSIPEGQCSSPCSQYPGATASASDPDMCVRPCGGLLLNLAGVDLAN